ncbi:MAG: hypothetical protein AB1485_03460 [Candidatus Thermoplasmatota archaeon]
MAKNIFAKLLALFRRRSKPKTQVAVEKTTATYATFEEVTTPEQVALKPTVGAEVNISEQIAREKPLVQLVERPEAVSEEELLKKKEEIEVLDETLRKYQLAREKELIAREEDLGKRVKLDEEVKKLVGLGAELVAKFPKELTKDLEKYGTTKEEELTKREEALALRERRLDERVKLGDSLRDLINTVEQLSKALEDYKRLEETRIARLERDLIAREKEIEEKLKFQDDVKRLLKILDELLGKLPKEVIEEFARSEDYELYEKVLKMYGV